MEVWKPVKGYEGYYEVSNMGNVRSLDRKRIYRDQLIPKTGKMLKLNLTKSGYHHVYLCSDREKKDTKVHRIVAEAFIPNPDSKPFINHINGNRCDNRAENLEWCNQSENMKHAYRVLGVRHPRRKLERSQVLSIMHDSRPYSDIAKEYGVCKQTIGNIKKGHRYTDWSNYNGE